MNMKKVAYPIRAVSKLTGISIDNLRAWERRYKAIEPSRSDRGRIYEEADVERLILLRQAVEGGHAISKLAALSNRELEALNTRSAALSRRPIDAADAGTAGATPDLKVLHDAISRFSCSEIEAELNRMAALFPARNLIHRVIVPLMTATGFAPVWLSRAQTIPSAVAPGQTNNTGAEVDLSSDHIGPRRTKTITTTPRSILFLGFAYTLFILGGGIRLTRFWQRKERLRVFDTINCGTICFSAAIRRHSALIFEFHLAIKLLVSCDR